MAIKLLVSKSGKDVFLNTNPNDYILHSDYNAFQIILEGKQTNETVNADPHTFVITHNLGYIPAAMAFAKYPDGYVAMAGTGQRTSGNYYTRRFYLQADSTKLYLVFYEGGTGSYNVDFKWYIFNSDI